MTSETKATLVSKLKEFFTFLFWTEPTQGQLMMKELNETAVMVRFLMPYMGWNTEIRTTLHVFTSIHPDYLINQARRWGERTGHIAKRNDETLFLPPQAINDNSLHDVANPHLHRLQFHGRWPLLFPQ